MKKLELLKSLAQKYGFAEDLSTVLEGVTTGEMNQNEAKEKIRLLLQKADLNISDKQKIESMSGLKKPLIIGNGDVLSIQQGLDLASQYQLDGVMIGRGVFANPWIFGELENTFAARSKQEKIALLLYHLDVWEQEYTNPEYPANSRFPYLKDYAHLKRFFKIYIKDFAHAPEMRQSLMNTQTIEQAKAVLEAE